MFKVSLSKNSLNNRAHILSETLDITSSVFERGSILLTNLNGNSAEAISHLIVSSPKNICWFQLLKCADLLLFLFNISVNVKFCDG